MQPTAPRLAAISKSPTVDCCRYHVLVPYQSKPNDTYVTWQVRLMYWSYQRVKAQCDVNPPCHLGKEGERYGSGFVSSTSPAPASVTGGFTRVLAADGPDGLMEEIPTIVVPPLNPRWFKLVPPEISHGLSLAAALPIPCLHPGCIRLWPSPMPSWNGRSGSESPNATSGQQTQTSSSSRPPRTRCAAAGDWIAGAHILLLPVGQTPIHRLRGPACRPACHGWQSFSFVQSERHREFSRRMLGNLSLAELSRIPKTGGQLCARLLTEGAANALSTF